MPDRPRHSEFQVLKIDIAPAKCEQFADHPVVLLAVFADDDSSRNWLILRLGKNAHSGDRSRVPMALFDGHKEAIFMAHIWSRGEGGWEAWALGAAQITLPFVVGGQRLKAATRAIRIVRVSNGGGSVWALMSPPVSGVFVNGREPLSGLRVLRDRDEIQVDGERLFFSTESPATVEPFPPRDRPVFCGRCRQAIEPGSPAVRCPNPDCQIYYHQDELGGFPCWTYASKCNFCPTETALDAGLAWAPEE